MPRQLPGFWVNLWHLVSLLWQARRADIILANRRTTLLLGLLFRFYKPRKLSLVGYEIIFIIKDNFRSRAAVFLWKLAVGRIDRLVVQSQGEVAYLARLFNTTPHKFTFIPFYTDLEPYVGPTSEGYVFSAGRMERDFATLLKALYNTRIPAVMVADSAQRALLEAHSNSYVQCYFNTTKEEYLALLRKARLVVVSLRQGISSRGQVVLLEAMRCGKPVICSHVESIKTYVTDGQTGWLVAPEDPESLQAMLLRYFPDTDTLQTIGRQAYQVQQRLYSPDAFHKNYHQMLREVYEWQHQPRRGRLAPASP